MARVCLARFALRRRWQVWILGLLLLAVAWSRAALAAWPHEASVNLPVCTAPSRQGVPAIVSDGAGGVLLAWQDCRPWGCGFDTIYMQHVLASGVQDSTWVPDGIAVSTYAGMQLNAVMVSDAAGGAILTWDDNSSGEFDIYVQHVLASGAVDPTWDPGWDRGVPLCIAYGAQRYAVLVSDGHGGAIVAWHDERRGIHDVNIYANHILASGVRHPAWPENGLALSAAPRNQVRPKIASDGAGGAIVVWLDGRDTTGAIYAQHVSVDGQIDPNWPVDGAPVCAVGYPGFQQCIPDGSGGAIVAWEDRRNLNSDVYAQHITSAGLIAPGWPAGGLGLSTNNYTQMIPVLVSDGAGGAIVAWSDGRRINRWDIYAQHVTGGGAVTWQADGAPVSAYPPSSKKSPTIVSDGNGGAIVSWVDNRNGSSDIYAQHMLAAGAPDPVWPADGAPVSTAPGDQLLPVSIPDGAGGAILTWQDGRNGTDLNIYAQRVDRYGLLGAEPTITAVRDAPFDEGGKVTLSWTASRLDTTGSGVTVVGYQVFRSVPGATVSVPHPNQDRLPGSGGLHQNPREIAAVVGSRAIAWEYVTTQSALQVPSYSLEVPTTTDSMASWNGMTMFMVRAVSAGDAFWDSAPDSGYSVDNLAPLMPVAFSGEYGSGTARLHWAPNREAALAGYNLYRAETEDFVPGPRNRVASLRDTFFTDPVGRRLFYKLSALDIHGNESPWAAVLPDSALAPIGGAVWLGPVTPNPVRGEALIRYRLPHEGRVSLSLFDHQGRRVTTLVHGELDAGEYVARWNGRDGAGREVSNGLYFVRLEAVGRTLTGRLVRVR